MSILINNWKKIVTIQLAIIGVVLAAQIVTVKLADGINNFANQYNTNYQSFTK